MQTRNINIYKMMEQVEEIKRFDRLREFLNIYSKMRGKTMQDGKKHYFWEYTPVDAHKSSIEAIVDQHYVRFIVTCKSSDAYTTEDFDIYNLPKSFINTIIYGILSLDTKEGRNTLNFILNGYISDDIKSKSVSNIIREINCYADRAKVSKISVINGETWIYGNFMTIVKKLAKSDIVELSQIVDIMPTYSNEYKYRNIRTYDKTYENTEIFTKDIYDSYNEYRNNLDY